MMNKFFLLFLASFLFLLSCGNPTKKDQKEEPQITVKQTEVKHLDQPDWVKNAVIYEVNTRQFSKEGTFAKVEEALPRIKELGVDIIWFMPIHEIGIKNRKEGLGSYYSIKDYTSVNHEFGTKDDFKKLVQTAHGLGLKVILDWVPNHTAWDHEWITSHPEYYTKNDKGEIIDPTNPDTGESWGWTDVADLNYDNKDLWKAMNEDMAYWVTDFDIDGFRCDVAGEVPIEFWQYNNPKLNAIKPLFMLAEGDKEELFEEFNMLYGWSFMGLMNEINEGKKDIQEVNKYMANHDKADLFMYFTANHDENTWNNAPMKYGKNYKNYAVLTYMIGGMPLVYNGQEGNLNHQVAFFTKDEIDWGNMDNTPFFKNMIQLYKSNNALWNGLNYGDYTPISSVEKTLCFAVVNNDEKIVVLQNYSDKETQVDVKDYYDAGSEQTNLLDNSKVMLSETMVSIAPNSSIVMK